MRRWSPAWPPGDGRAAHALAEVRRIANREGATGWDDALLCSELAVADGQEPWRGLAVRKLNAAMKVAAELHANHRWGWFDGLAGLGWVIERVGRNLSSGADLNGDIDTALLRELERGRWRGAYDVESGIAGIGLYFLERLPAGRAADGVALAIAHLEAKVGTRSISDPCEGAPLDPGRGVVGIVHFLDAANAAGIEKEKAARMRDALLALLLAREAKPALSWSSGLGGAAILIAMGQRPGDEALAAYGRRMLAIDGVAPEASLRHGTAGAAQVFQRVHQWTGDARSGEMARRCLDAALGGLAEGTLDDASFIDGAPGVALALLSAVSDVEPAWDRRLLLSRSEASE